MCREAAAAEAALPQPQPTTGAGPSGNGGSPPPAAAAAAASEVVGDAPKDESQQPHPPPWIRVTEALQYLVVDSRLVLHPGVSKAGLMAFTDPAPGTESTATVREG